MIKKLIKNALIPKLKLFTFFIFVPKNVRSQITNFTPLHIHIKLFVNSPLQRCEIFLPPKSVENDDRGLKKCYEGFLKTVNI